MVLRDIIVPHLYFITKKTGTPGRGTDVPEVLAFSNLPVLTPTSTRTEVHSAHSQEASILPEAGMPKKPGRGQKRDKEENKIPRTNWNSKGAFLKSKDSICLNKLFS